MRRAGSVETYYGNGRWRNRIQGGEPLPGSWPSRRAAAEAGLQEAGERRLAHVVIYTVPADGLRGAGSLRGA